MAHVISKQNPKFAGLINDLGSDNGLTLVIGAGASMDAGLPSWNSLLHTLLENGFKAATAAGKVDDADYTRLADTALASSGPMEAATIARLLHGNQRNEAIRAALYEGHSDAPAPGRIYRSIGALCRLLGEDVRIITTNYDDTLERAIVEISGFRPKALVVGESGEIVESSRYNQGEIQVVHLHGLIPYEGSPEGPIILDERDFAIEAVRPPGQILPKLLDSDQPTLFLGLSLTDPNIVATCHLLDSSRPRPWYGLFVRDNAEDGAIAAYSARRLDEMNIRHLPLVSFGQISQVLYELLHRLRLGSEYWSDSGGHRYGLRLERWRNRLQATQPGWFGGDLFRAEHDELHEALAGNLDQLLSEGVLRNRQPDEHFGLHLWVRQPTPEDLGYLDLVGASSLRHRYPWSLQDRRLKIRPGSGISAVEAVYFASKQRRNTTPVESRWEAVLAVPIDLVDEPDEFIIGGAITLSSTKSMVGSPLREHADSLADSLHSFGCELIRAPQP